MTENIEAEKPAEKTIDELLEEFPEATKPVVEDKSRMDNVLDFMEDFKKREQKKDIDTGISDAVSFFKEDEEITSSDLMLKGFLNAYADENPKVIDAFNNRANNPGAWKELLKLARDSYKSGLSTDTKISDAVTAAKASASGQTTEEPTPKQISNADLNDLSDTQFVRFKKLLAAGKTQEEALKSVK